MSIIPMKKFFLWSIDIFMRNKQKISFLRKIEKSNPDANEKLFGGRDHLKN